MEDNIIQKIYKNYDSYTNTERVIADYILNNYSYILYDTLSDLAYKIETSTTSIIRFARILGYEGYSQMRSAIRDYARLDDPFDARKTLFKLEDKNISEIFESSINKDIENLQMTIDLVNKDDLADAIKLLAQSRKVFVAGYNDSFCLAYYMTLRLGQVREDVNLLQSVGGMYPKDLISAKKDDVFLAYWFPRYSLYTLNMINIARKEGTKIIVISSPNTEKIKDFADIILPSQVHGGGVKESLIAPMSLSSYMASSVAVLNGDEAKDNISKAENILRSGFYLDT